MPIKLAVADKSPLVRAGLEKIFGEDDRFDLVLIVDDGDQLVDAVGTQSVDVAVIGWDMPERDAPGVLSALNGSKVRVVIYTGNPRPDVPRRAMQMGAAGFCSKTETPKRIIETVLDVADGRMVFPFMSLADEDGGWFEQLTQRERELLAMLSEGRTNQQIAYDLGISLNTVKFHLKNLFSKLDVSNRAQAVARYLTSQHA